ncbi:MAG: Ig-like domain-containing protein [Christensenellales bacterium]|jgi:hypothetical protein
MKKLLIGILLTVPIIILLATGLASTIIATRVYINVERVELNESEVVIDFQGGAGEVYDGLSAKVYPTGARNKDIIWSIEDVQLDDPSLVDGGFKIAEVDQSGVVTIYCYGVFTVKATSAEGNKFDTCRFIVGGNAVTSMRIADSVKRNYLVGDAAKLEALVFSVDALDKSVTWTVSGSAFTVSKNGIAEAVSPGKATITATSKANPEVTASIELTCLDSVFKFSHLYTSQTEVPLSALVFAKYSGASLALENCEISGGNLNITAYPASMSLSGQTLTIEQCGYDDITIRHADILSDGDFFLRMGGEPIYLEAIYRDGLRAGAPDAVFSSASPDIATVTQNGTASPKSAGEADITLTSALSSFTFRLKVIKPVTRILLDSVYSTSLDNAGIAGQRVFGIYSEEGGAAVNYRRITLRAPEEAGPDEFIWTAAGTADAAFEADDSNKLVFGTAPFEGKRSVTVTVRARYPLYQSIVPEASYTMTLVDSVNVYNLAQFTKYLDEGYGIALHSDIGLTDQYYAAHQSSESNGPTVTKNLYGNGKTVYRVLTSNNQSVSFIDSIINIIDDNVTLENATIRYGITDDAVSQAKGTSAYGQFRWGVRIANDRDTKKVISGINIRWCIMENAYNCAISQYANVRFKGCIFRNTPSAGLLIYSYNCLEAATTVLEDTVFSNSTAAPICLLTAVHIYDNEIEFEDIVTKYNTGVNKLHIEGFLDIYNWKDGENDMIQLFKLAPDMAKNFGMDEDTLQSLIDLMLGYTLKNNSTYEMLKYTINNHLYFHIGVFVMGGNLPADASLVTGYEQAGYALHEVPIPDFIKGVAPQFSNNCFLLSYSRERYSVSPDSFADYSENSKLYTELRSGRSK